MTSNPYDAPPKQAVADRPRSAAAWIVIICVCLISVCLRLIDSPVANLSSMVALAMFSGTVLRHPAGWLLPLGVRLLTDSIIHLKTGYGFFPSWPFDYSAYLLIYAIGFGIPATRRWSVEKRSAAVFGGAVGSIVIYFLMSNFGVWLLWPATYPRTMAGLADCFVQAIPFARGTIAGNLIAAPIFYYLWYAYASQPDAVKAESPLVAAEK